MKSVVGVDISRASVDYYNTQASNQGLEPDEMRAVCTELKGESGELDETKFNIVVVSRVVTPSPYLPCGFTRIYLVIQCCASYHHFPSIEDTTRVLASFLKPGGSLLVADIKAADDHRELFPGSYHHIVAHKHGLDEEVVRTAFEGAGLAEVEIRDGFRAKMRATGEEVQWFIARGIKPP